MIIPIPKAHAFVTGRAEGYSPLNAFDGALLDAGIGNVNLVKMSSIIPPRSEAASVSALQLPPGALVPTAYAYMESDVPGSRICAAVAAAYPEDQDKPALIMEYHAQGHREDAEQVVRQMAIAGMRDVRGWKIRHVECASIDHQVDKIGACIAAVVLWNLP